MNIQRNVSLKPYNTFGIDVSSKYFLTICTERELYEFIQYNKTADLDILIIGGGSNVLFTQNFNGIVLLNRIVGKQIIEENHENVTIKVGAGENWHSFVSWTVDNGWSGLENLSLIPGNVGAAPMQNIGAYGVEQKKCFHSLEAVNLSNGHNEIFLSKQCKFGYRESFFKQAGKNSYFITSVSYKLNKKFMPELSYSVLKDSLSDIETSLTPKIIADKVISIRESKLPNPKIIGNAGSFFKNPIIDTVRFNSLKEKFPDIISFPESNQNLVKVAAGWLIEKAGWKGYVHNNFGVHKNQALVLVNYGGALGKEIAELAEEIKMDIKLKFGIELESEVNII